MDPLELALQDLHKVEPRIVDLISAGEIDPWDVDLLRLCDLYIGEIKKKSDLRISGNAILTAAVLLRLKSSIFDEPRDVPMKEAGMILGVPEIEIVPLSRRVERKITVVELLDALNSAFQLEKGRVLANKARPDIKFYAVDLSKFMEKLLMELPESIVIEAMGPLILFSLLELANREVIEVEQEDWNGTIRVRKLGGGRIIHGGQTADSRRNI